MTAMKISILHHMSARYRGARLAENVQAEYAGVRHVHHGDCDEVVGTTSKGVNHYSVRHGSGLPVEGRPPPSTEQDAEDDGETQVRCRVDAIREIQEPLWSGKESG